MPEPQPKKRSWAERIRERRLERRRRAAERARFRAEEGVSGSALTDHARRRPEHFGGGGG